MNAPSEFYDSIEYATSVDHSSAIDRANADNRIDDGLLDTDRLQPPQTKD